MSDLVIASGELVVPNEPCDLWRCPTCHTEFRIPVGRRRKRIGHSCRGAEGSTIRALELAITVELINITRQGEVSAARIKAEQHRLDVEARVLARQRKRLARSARNGPRVEAT